ncbi:hypothetical protein PHYSODRAFT_315274 [Phytophthora sojae]|uniref:HAT C-terminal dimerisation domain-containing protein n=1 Tax=Phytophthora sojae (strain P6497) TaxID=1094619 RepID=G4ZGE8_PHYSP|nr:hypothetical protein PHYSODRAFT_315274 [Phytophthora sojae]EGZ18593.1 hypothetical protein PHYSODRAFT_315274 [Phytophthora sojae]|eukprot:XP_009527651.1 hypothetical protein PHYSODRAFT_315274 [Phytophthora sojae]
MHKKLSKPTHKQWLAIRCLCVLLSPFESVSRNLGGQLYPTLPVVLPALDALEGVLRNRELFDNILSAVGKEAYVDEVRVLMLECQAAMRRLFTERFDALKTSKLVWIAFLDPRMAMSMSHLTDENRAKAHADFLDAAVEVAELQSPPPQSSISAVSPDPDKMDFFTQFVLKATPDDSSQTPLRKACAQEIESYLASARALSKQHPNLSRLARKWLGAVATSVPSERAFSTSGNIITAKRSSLTPELVRDLVFIAENSKRAKRGGA